MNKGYDLVLGVVLIAVNSGILFGWPDNIPGVYLSHPLLLPLLPAPYLSIYLSPWGPYCTKIQLTHGAWPLCSALYDSYIPQLQHSPRFDRSEQMVNMLRAPR